MILLFATSGNNVGIGHVKRSAQLASRLQDNGIKAVLCLSHAFGNISAFKNYNVEIFVFSHNDQILDLISNYSATRVAIFDMLDISRSQLTNIKKKFQDLRILALDYFDMEDDAVDVIINLCNHNKQFAKPIVSSVKYLEGCEYAIIRPEFQSIINKQYSSCLEKIIISFGGSDPNQHTIPVLNGLLKLLPKVSVTVIIGPYFKHKQEILERVINAGMRVNAIENPTNVAEMFAEADLAVCGSGTTVLELATVGTPVLILPQSYAEQNFSSVFIKAGFAKPIGTFEGLDKHLFREGVEYFLNRNQRVQASESGKKICDGKGEQRIINELIKLYYLN